MEVDGGWKLYGCISICLSVGATVYFPATNIWQARTEPKCQFFAWLAMHNKVLTADNMMKKNWSCDER